MLFAYILHFLLAVFCYIFVIFLMKNSWSDHVINMLLQHAILCKLYHYEGKFCGYCARPVYYDYSVLFYALWVCVCICVYVYLSQFVFMALCICLSICLCLAVSELDIMVSQVLSVLPHIPADIIRNDLSMYNSHVIISFINTPCPKISDTPSFSHTWFSLSLMDFNEILYTALS